MPEIKQILVKKTTKKIKIHYKVKRALKFSVLFSLIIHSSLFINNYNEYPLSTINSWPVIALDSSLARKSATFAISSGLQMPT